MSRRLYIEYHDRGLGFIKNTNSALLSRNVNFVCLAFVTGILVPLASITSESMLLALLFTALLFYNPTVAGLVLLVFIPTVWFYYSAVRKRLHRYGVQENEAQREKARTVVETFRGYADLEINDAFPSMLRRFDRAMDKIVTIQSRNMTVNALPSIFMEVGLAIGMALFVAVSSVRRAMKPGPLRRIRRRRVAADAFGTQHDVRMVGTQIQPLHHRYPAGHRPERRKSRNRQPHSLRCPSNVKSPCATSRSASTTSAATKRCCTG